MQQQYKPAKFIVTENTRAITQISVSLLFSSVSIDIYCAEVHRNHLENGNIWLGVIPH